VCGLAPRQTGAHRRHNPPDRHNGRTVISRITDQQQQATGEGEARDDLERQ
jgi:hypothetical protein